MKRLLLTASAIALLSAPACAASKSDHRAAIQRLAETGAIVAKADRVCVGLKADQKKLYVLSVIAGMDIDDATDKAMLILDTAEASAELEKLLTKYGKARWCESAKRLYGANGATLKGLLIEDEDD
jgi:hypothetical protein